MKTKQTVLVSLALGLGLLAGIPAAQAQYTGHYPIGVEGIKGGSLPPPGVYLRDYNLFYWADRLNDPYGDPVKDPTGREVDFDGFVYANAIRPIWITKWKVLGGSYGMDVLVPLIYTDLTVGSPVGSCFGVGDVFFEPITLSWHWKQWDLGVGYGFWAPTGNTAPPPTARAGKGYWSNMFTLGATWFPDKAKTWSLSVLNRYEIHTQADFTNITPGDTFSMEAGLGKTIRTAVALAPVFYYQQQTTKDRASPNTSLDRVFGVGGEVGTFFPKVKLFVSGRYFYEFRAQDRPQGNTVMLTLTKIF